MADFWENSFKDKQEMWGWEPADSVNNALDFFIKHDINNILIPGFGYGRNAKSFIDSGISVTGIEISETAIALAKQHFDNNVKIHHGSVSAMPFDNELYDGIFSYSLLHLLNEKDRLKHIKDCYNQLNPNGYMVFVTISKKDFRFGQGSEIAKDTFEPWKGLTLFFYDQDSIQLDFEAFGLVESEEINEPVTAIKDKPSQKFWYIVCKKATI